MVWGRGERSPTSKKILRNSKNSTGFGGWGEVTNFDKILRKSKNSFDFGGWGVRSPTSTKFYEILRILLLLGCGA